MDADFEANDDLDLNENSGLVPGYDPDEPGDAGVRREIEDAEEDGRDSAPAVGSSDSPELMDSQDPLRRRATELGNEMADLDNTGMQITELTEEDDGPEW